MKFIKMYHLILITVLYMVLASYAQTNEPPYDKTSNCSCIEKEDIIDVYFVLNCTSRGFHQALTGYPNLINEKETQMDISFSNNEIGVMNKLNPTEALVSFSCRNCGLKDITANAFIDLPNIFKLDLSFNKLSDLRADMFRGHYNEKYYEPIGLIELDLSHNLIEVLEHGLFEHLPILKTLKLSHNQLKIEHPSTITSLASLKSIEKLNLAYTGISTIPLEILNSRLIELNIYGNEFTTVSENLTLYGGTLRLLNIGGNLLKEIDEKSFLKMSSLKSLYMSDMESLERINHGAFLSLTSLESLYSFNNTNLKSVHIGSLCSSNKLKILDVSNCSISTLQLTSGNSSDQNNHTIPCVFPDLRTVRIHKNPWHCDCFLFKVLQKLMKLDDNDFQSENTARCSTPYELTSDLLIDITVDTLCLVSNSKKLREPIYETPPFLRPRSILFSLLSILVVVLIGLCIGFAIVLIKKKLKQNEIGFSSPIRYQPYRPISLIR